MTNDSAGPSGAPETDPRRGLPQERLSRFGVIPLGSVALDRPERALRRSGTHRQECLKPR